MVTLKRKPLRHIWHDFKKKGEYRGNTDTPFPNLSYLSFCTSPAQWYAAVIYFPLALIPIHRFQGFLPSCPQAYLSFD